MIVHPHFLGLSQLSHRSFFFIILPIGYAHPSVVHTGGRALFLYTVRQFGQVVEPLRPDIIFSEVKVVCYPKKQ